MLAGASLERLTAGIPAMIDCGISSDPRGALLATITATEPDGNRPGFRGRAFNIANVEYGDAHHPARVQGPLLPGIA